MKLRLLLTAAVSLAAAVRVLSGPAPQPGTPAGPYDLLIRNGRVLDGSGNPWQPADIAIRGGRIAAMGRLDAARATRVIDASGLTVTPGFIDVHSHAAQGLSGALNEARPLLAQGLTTVVLNPDGGGPVDIRAERTVFEQHGIGVNVAMYVPHGSIRREVLGMADRAPTPAELDRMLALARAGMEAGAIGLSSGPYYAPGSYAKTDELVAMARVAAAGGGVYESHIRDEGDYSIGVVAAVQEVIRISEEAKLPGIVAHMKALGPANWGLSMAMVTRIDQARARGIPVYADQYPYDASGTSVVGALVPRWAEVGGMAELKKRVDGGDRDRLVADMQTNLARRGGAGKLMISRYEPDPSIEGKTLAAVAHAMGRPPVEAALDLLMKGNVGLVSFNMSEADIEEIMKQPFTMTCTDGDLVPAGQGKPHPRGNGAFARKLRVYVEERGVIDLPFAIRSMTSLPASVFGMKDRGVLRPGAHADILIFDPAKVRDEATYQDPHRLSEGFDYVIVNGRLARDRGTFMGALAGAVVTPERQ
ncbi:MAG: N-acyl-D-amino-acid deacylase family protein [Betaproteobacteria bacterium]